MRVIPCLHTSLAVLLPVRYHFTAGYCRVSVGLLLPRCSHGVATVGAGRRAYAPLRFGLRLSGQPPKCQAL